MSEARLTAHHFAPPVSSVCVPGPISATRWVRPYQTHPQGVVASVRQNHRYEMDRPVIRWMVNGNNPTQHLHIGVQLYTHPLQRTAGDERHSRLKTVQSPCKPPSEQIPNLSSLPPRSSCQKQPTKLVYVQPSVGRVWIPHRRLTRILWQYRDHNQPGSAVGSY